MILQNKSTNKNDFLKSVLSRLKATAKPLSFNMLLNKKEQRLLRNSLEASIKKGEVSNVRRLLPLLNKKTKVSFLFFKVAHGASPNEDILKELALRSSIEDLNTFFEEKIREGDIFYSDLFLECLQNIQKSPRSFFQKSAFTKKEQQVIDKNFSSALGMPRVSFSFLMSLAPYVNFQNQKTTKSFCNPPDWDLLQPCRTLNKEMVSALLPFTVGTDAATDCLRLVARFFIPTNIPLDDIETGFSKRSSLDPEDQEKLLDIIKLILPYADAKAHHSQALQLADAAGHEDLFNLLYPLSNPEAAMQAILTRGQHLWNKTPGYSLLKKRLIIDREKSVLSACTENVIKTREQRDGAPVRKPIRKM